MPIFFSATGFQYNGIWWSLTQNALEAVR